MWTLGLAGLSLKVSRLFIVAVCSCRVPENWVWLGHLVQGSFRETSSTTNAALQGAQTAPRQVVGRLSGQVETPVQAPPPPLSPHTEKRGRDGASVQAWVKYISAVSDRQPVGAQESINIESLPQTSRRVVLPIQSHGRITVSGDASKKLFSGFIILSRPSAELMND